MSRAGIVAVLLVGAGLASASPAGAEPVRPAARPPVLSTGGDEPGAPATAPASRPAPSGEHRFDALRIDGQQRGPAVLEVRALQRAGRTPLLRLRRSFVNRIFATIETPALHGH